MNFLNHIASIVYAIEHQTINRYVGNYDKYLELSALKSEQYENERVRQREKINKLTDYIARNSARASTARSAESRKKQLAKIDVLTKRASLAPPKMSFRYKKPQSSIILDAKALQIGYDFALIAPLTFQLRDGQK